MRVTSNGKVWRSEAEWRTICEQPGTPLNHRLRCFPLPAPNMAARFAV